MTKYIIKRILSLIPVIIGVSALVYFIMELAPGNYLSMIIPDDATPEQIAALTAQYGYDKPVIIRYINYMIGLLHGDLGKSWALGEDVFKVYMERMPNTLVLGMASVIFSVILSIPLGIYSACHQGSLADNGSMLLSLLGMATPNFWLGMMLIVLFSLKLHWLPSSGFHGWKSVILPMITIGTGTMAGLTRTTRSSMLDTIRQDYLRTARAKGVVERDVIYKHALKPAMIPIITVIGTQIKTALSGAVVTEAVFAWPGVGRLVVEAVNARDIPMLTGCIILKTITASIILLIVDLLYAYVDPRVKAKYVGKKG